MKRILIALVALTVLITACASSEKPDTVTEIGADPMRVQQSMLNADEKLSVGRVENPCLDIALENKGRSREIEKMSQTNSRVNKQWARPQNRHLTRRYPILCW